MENFGLKEPKTSEKLGEMNHASITNIIQTWYESCVEDFKYIHRIFIRVSDNIFEFHDAFVALIRSSNVSMAIDFLAHYGYDINMLHLNPDSQLARKSSDPSEYEDPFSDYDEEILDKICVYLKSSTTQPQFMVRIVLTNWARGYYDTLSDTNLINSLYESLDEKFRSSLISHAIYENNIKYIEYASNYGFVELDFEAVKLILRINQQTKYMDIILDKTDFIEKITNLPTDSDLNDIFVVKIINKIKK